MRRDVYCSLTSLQFFRLSPGVEWCDALISNEHVRKLFFPNLRYFSGTWLKEPSPTTHNLVESLSWQIVEPGTFWNKDKLPAFTSLFIKKCQELKYNIKYIWYSHIQLYILLDYTSNMFRPNCRAILRLIFEQVECSKISLKMALQLGRNMWLEL